MPSVELLADTRPLRVGISGAGPGGLGAALFLHQINDLMDSGDGRHGVDIQLFDQARELREVGAVSFDPFLRSNLIPLSDAELDAHQLRRTSD